MFAVKQFWKLTIQWSLNVETKSKKQAPCGIESLWGFQHDLQLFSNLSHGTAFSSLSVVTFGCWHWAVIRKSCNKVHVPWTFCPLMRKGNGEKVLILFHVKSVPTPPSFPSQYCVEWASSVCSQHPTITLSKSAYFHMVLTLWACVYLLYIV